MTGPEQYRQSRLSHFAADLKESLQFGLKGKKYLAWLAGLGLVGVAGAILLGVNANFIAIGSIVYFTVLGGLALRAFIQTYSRDLEETHAQNLIKHGVMNDAHSEPDGTKLIPRS